MKSERYARKTYYVDVVTVTEENIEEAAEWCQGEVHLVKPKKGVPEQKYIRVRVFQPKNDRQSMAFPGDRILYAGTGYKVFSPKAFEKSFELVKEG